MSHATVRATNIPEIVKLICENMHMSESEAFFAGTKCSHFECPKRKGAFAKEGALESQRTQRCSKPFCANFEYPNCKSSGGLGTG